MENSIYRLGELETRQHGADVDVTFRSTFSPVPVLDHSKEAADSTAGRLPLPSWCDGGRSVASGACACALPIASVVRVPYNQNKCANAAAAAATTPPPQPRALRCCSYGCGCWPVAAAGTGAAPPLSRSATVFYTRSIRPTTVSVETAMREVEVLGVSPQRRRFGKLNLSPCTDRSRTSEGKKNSFSGLTIGASLFAEGKCTLLAWRLKKLSIF